MPMSTRRLIVGAPALVGLSMLVYPPPADAQSEQAASLPGAWQALAGTDTATALRGLWTLARVPKEAVPFTSERLQGLLAGATPRRIAQLIDDLDSSKFATRERADRELEEVIDTAAPYLQRVLNNKPGLEMSRRVERLLASQTVMDAGNPRRLQAARAVALLESLTSPEARAVLATVAQDGREAWLAKEAEAA